MILETDAEPEAFNYSYIKDHESKLRYCRGCTHVSFIPFGASKKKMTISESDISRISRKSRGWGERVYQGRRNDTAEKQTNKQTNKPI